MALVWLLVPEIEKFGGAEEPCKCRLGWGRGKVGGGGGCWGWWLLASMGRCCKAEDKLCKRLGDGCKRGNGRKGGIKEAAGEWG